MKQSGAPITLHKPAVVPRPPARGDSWWCAANPDGFTKQAEALFDTRSEPIYASRAAVEEAN